MFIKKYNKIIFSGLIIVLSFLMVAQAGLADTPEESKAKNYGLDATAQTGMGISKDTIENSNLSSMIGKIVGAALSFLGVVFFILIIYGGYMWMFSMGNEQTAGKAKDIIIAAVIGLVIVLMAYAITFFLGTNVVPGTPAS
ncbi:MAG: hypothetical protein V1801_02640 [Candidatus Falkowbacteria bacterium]